MERMNDSPVSSMSVMLGASPSKRAPVFSMKPLRGRRGLVASAPRDTFDAAFEYVDAAAAARRDLDAELGALIHEGGLGREDLEAAGRCGLDFDRGLAHIQPARSGREQLQGGRGFAG